MPRQPAATAASSHWASVRCGTGRTPNRRNGENATKSAQSPKSVTQAVTLDLLCVFAQLPSLSWSSLLPATATPVAQQARHRTRATALALGELSKSLEDLAARVSPCVVQIFVTGYAPPERAERRRDRRAGDRAEQRLGRHRRSPTATSSPTRTSSRTRRGIEVELPAAATGAAPDARSSSAAGGSSARTIVGDRSRDRSGRDQGRRDGPADVAVRRLRRAAARADRARVRQPARPRLVGDAGRGQRGRAPAAARRPDDLHPDRRRRSIRATAAVRSSTPKAAWSGSTR